MQKTVIITSLYAWLMILVGCRLAAPIYVWQPAQHEIPKSALVAIAPIVGEGEFAQQLESALHSQRSFSPLNFSVVTARDLTSNSPVQTASYEPLASDLVAIQAAKNSQAGYLLMGTILKANIENAKPPEVTTAAYEAASRKFAEPDGSQEALVTTWRLVDTARGQTIATEAISLNGKQADELYPDLLLTQPDPTSRLFVASAREAWKLLSPSVAKDEVELMIPWLQPGAILTRVGVVDAMQGRWDLAEPKWQRAVERNPYNISARHNLALAMVAREDFTAARQILDETPKLLKRQLPGQTRFWLDRRQRGYCIAHGLGEPSDGWMIPDPAKTSLQTEPIKPLDLDDQPWWTAIPFAKPPGWTWKDWLFQPLVL